MPAFNYTSGDISHLTGGGGATMVDIQGPFTDVRAALNGNLDEINVPNLAAAFTHYRTVTWGGVTAIGTSLSANTFMMTGGPTAVATSNVVLVGSSGPGAWKFDLDPTDWAANARTTKLNIRWGCLTNAVAPAISITCGLYPVASFGGASGAAPTVATVGTVVSGSTATFTTPAATSNIITSSGDFNAPAVGPYIFGLTATGVGAANSVLVLSAHLRFREV